MCPNTEFFLVRIFPHSDWIRRDTKYFRMRENTDQKKLRIWTLSRSANQNVFVVSFQTTIIDVLQLILIWTWNINKIYVHTIKLTISWPLLSEIVILFLPFFLNFYKDHNKKCPLTTFVQLSKHISYTDLVGKYVT